LQIADRVQFLGRQSRLVVAQAMRRCAVFALPSRYEGLGCVYLEAMASGKPAIACRGQGIEEIIQHGNNGWLVEQGNLRELTEVLSQLLRDSGLRARIGAEARAAILARFTLAHQAQATAELYRSCLA
jgi:glycosyltransferase involved in cell wall biosynthesis